MSETSEQKKKNGGAAQPTAVLERKLKGHTGWVNSVALIRCGVFEVEED